MAYKFKISKAGYNAITETNYNNLVFSSDFNTLKYYVSGNVSIYVPSGTSPQTYETTIVSHNLGYYPFFVAFARFDSPAGQYYIMPLTFADGGFWGYNLVYTTTSSLIYRAENGNIWGQPVGGYNIYIYYKIFKNNLGL